MQSIDDTHDPSPSRLNYRIQRWMLTPGIRLGLRIGVPFCLTLALSSAFLADERRRDALQFFAFTPVGQRVEGVLDVGKLTERIAQGPEVPG